MAEENRIMESLSNSDVIAISSAVIAVCSFFATAWQAWIARDHNRLSVRPKLIWHINRVNNEKTTSIAFSIRNFGLGPAIIMDRYFAVDGCKFQHTKMSIDEVSEVAEHVLANKVSYKLRNFGMPGVGSFVPSGGEVVVVVIDFPFNSAQQIEFVADILSVVDFHANYESVYGEKFTLCSKD